MNSWDEIHRWRRSQRTALMAWRRALGRDQRNRVRPIVAESILKNVPELGSARIGFYWPFKGEIDLRHLVRKLVSKGADASLPVVVEKNRPLEFWRWCPRMKMQRGVWKIPVPAERSVSQPTALLVPLLGVDEAGYRLGYGGGYYDRTLAAMTPRPLTIGVGYGISRLRTIHPQPHDIPMDAIVTEASFEWFRFRGVPLEAAIENGSGTKEAGQNQQNRTA
jgi:5-formyltetrahydrofolate cyclo-ligase